MVAPLSWKVWPHEAVTHRPSLLSPSVYYRLMYLISLNWVNINDPTSLVWEQDREWLRKETVHALATHTHTCTSPLQLPWAGQSFMCPSAPDLLHLLFHRLHCNIVSSWFYSITDIYLSCVLVFAYRYSIADHLFILWSSSQNMLSVTTV